MHPVAPGLVGAVAVDGYTVHFPAMAMIPKQGMPMMSDMTKAAATSAGPLGELPVAFSPTRWIGMPAENAGPIAFFLSPAAGFVTGQILYVCSGGSIGRAPV